MPKFMWKQEGHSRHYGRCHGNNLPGEHCCDLKKYVEIFTDVNTLEWKNIQSMLVDAAKKYEDVISASFNTSELPFFKALTNLDDTKVGKCINKSSTKLERVYRRIHAQNGLLFAYLSSSMVMLSKHNDTDTTDPVNTVVTVMRKLKTMASKSYAVLEHFAKDKSNIFPKSCRYRKTHRVTGNTNMVKFVMSVFRREQDMIADIVKELEGAGNFTGNCKLCDSLTCINVKRSTGSDENSTDLSETTDKPKRNSKKRNNRRKGRRNKSKRTCRCTGSRKEKRECKRKCRASRAINKTNKN